MTEIPQYAWAIDQAGPKLTAAILRGQHHDATSGGTGVGSPRALKIVPQAAPDNTVMVLPGGGTAKSTYAGHEGQSYQATNFKPQTLEIPPTGSSSGGRTDLIIQRFLDPNEELHPDYDYPDGDEIPPEVAKDLWQWRFECKTGMDRTAKFDYPHVKLSELVRPANTTIVNDSHIVDLRELARPQQDSDVITYVYGSSAPSDMGGNNGSWFTASQTQVVIPEWCNKFIIQAQAAGMYWTGGFGRGDFSINMDGVASTDNAVPFRFSGADSQGFIDTHTTVAHSLPPSERGKPKNVDFRFRNMPASADGSRIRPTTSTRFTLNLKFLQVAE